jgi:hypothetical protein
MATAMGSAAAVRVAEEQKPLEGEAELAAGIDGVELLARFVKALDRHLLAA